MQSEEEKLNRTNNAPTECDDHFAPALYTSLFANKLINAASQRRPEEGGGSTIRVTALRGRGFVIKKRKLKKDDVPDTYCVIRMNNSKEEWKTATIKDDCMPNWNETRDFAGINPARSNINVDVYDKNGHRGKDDFVGSARFSVETLLRKRLMELELRSGNVRTKSYVTITCVQVAATTSKEMTAGVGDVLIHCQPDLGDEGVESTILAGSRSSGCTHEDKERVDVGGVATPIIAPSHIPSRVVSPGTYCIDDGSVAGTCSNSDSPRRRRMIRALPARLREKMHRSRKDPPPNNEEGSI